MRIVGAEQDTRNICLESISRLVVLELHDHIADPFRLPLGSARGSVVLDYAF